MASITLTWRTSKDDRVCPFCNSLDGYTWTISTSESTPFLLMVNGLQVWDFRNNYPLSHETAGINYDCRCRVETIAVDVKDIQSAVSGLLASAHLWQKWITVGSDSSDTFEADVSFDEMS